MVFVYLLLVSSLLNQLLLYCQHMHCGNSSVKILRRKTKYIFSVCCCNIFSRFIIIIIIIIVIVVVVVVVVVDFVLAIFKKP